MSPWWVAPFGYLRINCYLHIPAACRSLSRPSSPQRAKASSVRPYLLSLAFDTNITADTIVGTNITANTGFLLYAFLLKFCFFQHVNELGPPQTPPQEGPKVSLCGNNQLRLIIINKNLSFINRFS